MDWLDKISGIAKVPIKLFAVFLIVSGSLVLVNQSTLEKFHLSKFMQEYGAYVSILFVFSGAILLVEVIITVQRRITQRRSQRATESSILEKLKNLDSSEASVVRELMFDGNSTTELPIDNPSVATLLDKKVLKQVGTLGNRSVVGALFPLCLTDFANEHLKAKHIGLSPYLIDNPENKIMVNDSGIEWIRNNRPSFVDRIEKDRALFEGRLF